MPIGLLRGKACFEFVSAQGKFLVDAKDLVFHEMPSVVKKNGKPVQW